MGRGPARADERLTMAGSVPSVTTLDEIREASERGDHELVLRLTDALLAKRPGDDAAHEYRARAFLALGRPDEAERHAADAVRLDPDEIRYRELLAQVLSAEGAHRDAAAEYGRLARNDPRQTAWTVAEAEERLGAAQPGMGVDAARRAVRLAPDNGRAQLALAQALARTGDARGALQSATRATVRLPKAQLAGVLEGGAALSDGDGVLEKGQDGDSVYVRIGSGKYQFAYPMSK